MNTLDFLDKQSLRDDIPEFAPGDTLDVHVKRLRAKVEPDPANPTRIVTIRGLGYKYERPRG